MNSDKAQLRKYIRSVDCSAEDPLSLWDKIESLPVFQTASTVLLYWSLPDEVPTRGFIEKWYGKKRVVLPVVIGDEMELRMFSPEKMTEGYRGILEPSSDAVKVPAEQIDFAIVPGVAFDRRCNRMGRGKGFYDRFLPSLKCPAVGVSFDARVVDSIPVDEWDVPLSAVVTPTDIYRQ